MLAIEDIKKAVLALPARQRAALAETLLGSLLPPPEECSGAEELAEAERRDQEIESGLVRPLNEEEFQRQLEAARRR
jgi:putative addiction module component (TIGR02574 family)